MASDLIGARKVVMPNQQLEWIAAANEPEKRFRGMIVGWQTLLESLNATVNAFNTEYLNRMRENADSMREIALKRLTIASLFEIEARLDDWYRVLRDLNTLTPDTEELKRQIRPEMRYVERFVGIRNLTFHYGDPLQPAAELVDFYREIDELDLNQLNNALRALVTLGEALKHDALAHAD